jgi:proton glutamate symport protein
MRWFNYDINLLARTTVNVIGNCTATVVMAKWENVFDEEKARNFTNEI